MRRKRRRGVCTMGRLRVRLKAPPVDGKANQELVAWLARELKVPRASIELIRGDRARRKQLRVGTTQRGQRPLGASANDGS